MTSKEEIEKHKNDFISEWTPRLRMWIKDVAGPRRLSEDQLQEYRTAATYGLMGALANYDKSKGASFDTFAAHHVKGHLKNHMARSGDIKSNVLGQIQEAEREARKERQQAPQQPASSAPKIPTIPKPSEPAEPKSPTLPVQKPTPDRP
jgi:DNA-directed RNA polymerase specialized sigma subunit